MPVRFRIRSDDVDHGAGGQVLLDQGVTEDLVQIDLGFPGFPGVALEFENVEAEVVQSGTHGVKAIFGFHDDFVKALLQCPLFLLFGEGAIVTLAAPFRTGTPDPAVKHASSRETDAFLQVGGQIGQLRVGLIVAQAVSNLERHRDQFVPIPGRRRQGNQDQVFPSLQATEELRGAFLGGKFWKILLQVRNFLTATFQGVLLNDMSHGFCLEDRTLGPPVGPGLRECSVHR